MKILNQRIDDDPWMLEDEHYLRSSQAPFSESVQKLHSCHPRSILGSMLVRCSLWCCCGNQAWQSQRLVLLVHPNKQEKDGMLGSNVSIPRGLAWGPTIMNWTGINHRNKLKEDKPTSVSVNSFFKFSYFFTSPFFFLLSWSCFAISARMPSLVFLSRILPRAASQCIAPLKEVCFSENGKWFFSLLQQMP